jgi:subtilisin family serine protease
MSQFEVIGHKPTLLRASKRQLVFGVLMSATLAISAPLARADETRSTESGGFDPSAASLQSWRGMLSTRAERAKSAPIRYNPNTVHERVQVLLARASEQAKTSESAKRTGDMRFSITVVLRSPAAMGDAKAALADDAITHVGAMGRSLVARATTDEIAALSRLDGVKMIDRYMPTMNGTFKGSQLTEGDALLKAQRARSRFGIDGTGTHVCVISDGAVTRAAAQATGDLPAAVEVCTNSPGEGDEGTAMLEIVHDLAPGAKLAFCSGIASGETFVEAVEWSATQAFGGRGCDVIVDDLYFLDEPRFQISGQTQTINEFVRDRGITYVTAAGNLAGNAYRAYFRDADAWGNSKNAGLHDFGATANGPSNVGFPVILPPGTTATITLQWNEAVGQARNDLVMEPFTQDGKRVREGASGLVEVQVSDFTQDGSGFPFEFAEVRNDSSTQQVIFMVVQRKSGRDFIELSMVNGPNGGAFYATNFLTGDGSIIAHSGAEEAISVAAVRANSPDLSTIEPFSSRGLVRTYFDAFGNRTFDIAYKPDVTAVDGVAVTGVGGFGSPFFGTSAAAPHVAGIAALIRGANAQADVKRIMRVTSQDRGPGGVDTTWGFGVVDAEEALRLAPYFRRF